MRIPYQVVFRQQRVYPIPALVLGFVKDVVEEFRAQSLVEVLDLFLLVRAQFGVTGF